MALRVPESRALKGAWSGVLGLKLGTDTDVPCWACGEAARTSWGTERSEELTSQRWGWGTWLQQASGSSVFCSFQETFTKGLLCAGPGKASGVAVSKSHTAPLSGVLDPWWHNSRGCHLQMTPPELSKEEAWQRTQILGEADATWEVTLGSKGKSWH